MSSEQQPGDRGQAAVGSIPLGARFELQAAP